MENKFSKKLQEILTHYEARIDNLKKLASLDKNYKFDVNEVNESLDDSISYLKDEMNTDLELKINEMKQSLEDMFDEIDEIVKESKVW